MFERLHDDEYGRRICEGFGVKGQDDYETAKVRFSGGD